MATSMSSERILQIEQRSGGNHWPITRTLSLCGQCAPNFAGLCDVDEPKRFGLIDGE